MAFKMKYKKGGFPFKKETHYLDDKKNPPEPKKWHSDKMMEKWEGPGWDLSKPNRKDFNNLATKSDTIAYENAYNKWKQAAFKKNDDPSATRPLEPGEGKPYAGGIHTTMWKAAGDLGKKIYKKIKK